jgi:hypothetical protein
VLWVQFAGQPVQLLHGWLQPGHVQLLPKLHRPEHVLCVQFSGQPSQLVQRPFDIVVTSILCLIKCWFACARSCGLRRRIDPSPADVALEGDHDAWRRGSLGYRFFRGPGAFSKALKIHFAAWSISSSSPKLSALHSALRKVRLPFRPCGRDIRHTIRQPSGLPFSSPPRRATVSRRPTRPRG